MPRLIDHSDVVLKATNDVYAYDGCTRSPYIPQSQDSQAEAAHCVPHSVYL